MSAEKKKLKQTFKIRHPIEMTWSTHLQQIEIFKREGIGRIYNSYVLFIGLLKYYLLKSNIAAF